VKPIEGTQPASMMSPLCILCFIMEIRRNKFEISLHRFNRVCDEIRQVGPYTVTEGGCQCQC